MERWVGKIAVVTGASAGIGASICEHLVKHGMIVVGVARRQENVDKLGKSLSKFKGKLYAHKCDISKNSDITSTFKWIREKIGPVSVLVNNAGIFRFGSFSEGDPEDWRKVLETNVLGLTSCSREAIGQMRQANIAGHIFHINSIAGHGVIAGDPVPCMNIYSPSKHAVTCIAEVMRREMAHFKTNIKITSVSPGLVDTEIGEAAGYSDFKMLCQNNPHLKPDDVAEAVVYALGTPSHVDIHEITLRPVNEVLGNN